MAGGMCGLFKNTKGAKDTKKLKSKEKTKKKIVKMKSIKKVEKNINEGEKTNVKSKISKSKKTSK